MNTEQPKLTNPGRRLYKILEQTRGKAGAEATRIVLARVFGTKPDQVALLYTKLGSFLMLIEEFAVRLDVLQHPDAEFYRRCVPRLRQALSASLNLDTSWNHYVNQISDSDMALIHIASKALDAVQSEVELSQVQLSEVLNDATSLFDRVKSSEIEPELQVVLLDLLEVIRRTIADYQIRGAEGLKKALAESMGRLVLEKDAVMRNEKKDEVKGFWELLRKITVLLTIANQAPQLGERIALLLKGIWSE